MGRMGVRILQGFVSDTARLLRSFLSLVRSLWINESPTA